MSTIDLEQYEAHTIKTGIHYRNVEMVVREMEAGKNAYEFICSSEEPVEDRWMYDEENTRYVFGTEILLHGPENVNMGWLSSGNAPFLMDHDTCEQVAVILGATLENRVLKVTGLKFSRSDEGVESQQDIDDGIRKNVSIGYVIEQLVEVVAPTNGQDGVYHVTRWTPYEVSSVSIPAVQSVGFGRSKDQNFDTIVYRKKQQEITKQNGEGTMSLEQKNEGGTLAPDPVVAGREFSPEHDRVEAIRGIAQVNAKVYPAGAEIASRAIAEGKTREEFWKEYQPALLKESERQATIKIGLTDKDKKRFSLIKLVRALDVTDHEVSMKDAGFEVEVSHEYCSQRGISPSRGGVIIPHEAIQLGQRASITAGSPANGAGAQMEIHSGEVIEYLRAESVIAQAGARFLNGLVGKFDMGRIGVGTTSYWVGEVDETGADVTASSMDIDLVQFTIKTIGAWQGITRQMTKQTSLDVESIIRADLFASLGDGIDKAALAGSGSSNQPTGIAYTSGVGTLAFATAQTPLWTDIVKMETTVAEANALRGSLSYVINPTLMGVLKGMQKGTYLGFVVEGNETNGFPALRSTNAIKSSTKNIIFGNFNELMVGTWGGLELVVDPYTYSRKGVIGITAFQDIDVQLRHAASFIYTTN